MANIDLKDLDLDQYVAPLIDGNLGEPNQGFYTNICDSHCGPAPKATQLTD